MKKKFGIFWIERERKIYGDDSYYTLGTIWKITDTIEEAENEILEMNLKSNDFITVIPIYSNTI